ncbi:hypothetical protein LY90DRAFT_675834 [Neocallimastix californiae]|uniref:RGS domain-containing protein n=1 Tax=Neocallimastix californiae TaxID=1754190 RepID=A0A1Y2AJ43_9FUNG|nr:hypothetical protein LY90DRAFT_675834 [Neocallimastix californiae]|eukprot:ORY22603.1 hypothetical protein LY90DRAFT_675834 [Neocallimastix californiae]
MFKEKRSLENLKMFDEVDIESFNKYLSEPFIDNNENKIERRIYLIIDIIFNIFALVSLFFFIKLRKSYIIRQRGFGLTFAGGIVTYLSGFMSFIPQLVKTTCLTNVFQANILNTIAICIFFSRSLRIILYYHYNIFIVTSIKKKRSNVNYNIRTIEPNYYLPRITKKIKNIISLIIIVPPTIALIACIVIYINNEHVRENCIPFKLYDTLLVLKNNKGTELFEIIKIYGIIYNIICVINTIALFYIKDANKYGAKFECLSVTILLFLANIANSFIQVKSSVKDPNSSKPLKIYLKIFEKTKGGRMIFAVIIIYMFFMSITVPVIQYYMAKKVKNEYFQDPMSSIQYFYKVLNTPSLVNELRDIAIKEFCVENVLFWENYQILQTMAYRYQIELKKAQEQGDARILTQYDFEGYYQKQVQSFSVSSMDDYSYDPNTPVPKEILPYYTSFYYMFIDFNGPAVVNLMGSTIRTIFRQLSTCPTIGIYDFAKNEVVELMYSSIYPILLRNNKKHMAHTLG